MDAADTADTAWINSVMLVKPDWLIVDRYALDERREGELIPCAHRIFIMDDLADHVHDCDLLLDQVLFIGKGRSDGF